MRENSEEFTIQNGDSGKLTLCELENGHRKFVDLPFINMGRFSVVMLVCQRVFTTPTNHGQSEVPMKKQPDTKVLPVTASGHQL